MKIGILIFFYKCISDFHKHKLENYISRQDVFYDKHPLGMNFEIKYSE